MRILYWTPQFWPEIGGIQVLATKALPALKECGHEILVVTSHVGPGRSEIEYYKDLPIHRFHFWKSLHSRDISQIIEITKKVTELKETFQPELIHIDFSGYTAYFQHKTSNSYACPTVISVHGDLTNLKAGPDTIFQKQFQSASWVTTVSSFVLEKTRQLIPGISNQSSIIYGCSNIPSIEPAPLNFIEPCIVGIGRLAKEKGFDLLIESINLIEKNIPNFKAKIIGNGPEGPLLEELVKKLNLKDKIEFAGMIKNEDIFSEFNSATIVVIPSRIQEAFPVVAIEAALMARPVVATNMGGLPEIVLDGRTGRLVDNERPDMLARAITNMLQDPKETTEMGNRAKTRAEKKFIVDRYVFEYEELYKRLAEEHKTKAGE